ncbi:MAG TPA: tetratricopeptide repeat protein, partial [Archaeoglobaceae archaeon]|nr:tetratricopeptide repeat protein [Archaeoglobaceae archaeon]
MSEKFGEVRELIKKRVPLEALLVLKKDSPDNVKKVIENLFENPTAVNELDEEWRDILSLIYYSYFSFITSTMVDAQSISECAVSSLNAANYSKKLKFPELQIIFLMNAGQALNQMSMNERAIKCYLEAEKIINKMDGGNLAEHSAILNNIGAIYIELKRIDDA